MLVPRIETAPAGTPVAPAALPAPAQLSLEGQVQSALNLWLPLKTPAQMPALLGLVAGAAEEVHAALKSLHYVHFARFLPALDGSMLWVITTYDGGLESYIMDFVGVLGDVFTSILQFIAGAPPLPVAQHAPEFVKFVSDHNVKQATVWSAYPDLTVIDILRAGRSL